MKKDKLIKIPVSGVVLCSIVYLVLPLVLFFVGWLKPILAILATTAIIIPTVLYVKDQNKIHAGKYIEISILQFVVAVIAILLFVWLGGVGGLSVINYDTPWRDAIFSDLIDYTWPVVYPETKNNLMYYFCTWLVPALFGKIFGHFVAKLFLILWVSIGLLLVYLLICNYIEVKKKSFFSITLIVFLLFNGIKMIGMAVVEICSKHNWGFDLFQAYSPWLDMLYNGYAFDWYYRFTFDAICNVYNQAAPVWIVTMLVLMNREKIENYAFIGLLLLPYAPLPFVGIFVLLVMMAIVLEKNNKESIIRKLKGVFSIRNILAILAIVPTIGLFYTSNENITSESMSILRFLPIELFGRKEIFCLVLFYIVEFGIYLLFVYKNEKKNPLFYYVLIMLLICPLIEFGGQPGARDFCMNTTMPALLILMIFVLKYIRDDILDKTIHIKGVILIVCLVLASQTPIGHMCYRLDLMVAERSLLVGDSFVGSMADKDYSLDMLYLNFLMSNDSDTLWHRMEKSKSIAAKEKDKATYATYKDSVRNDLVDGFYYISPDKSMDNSLFIDNDSVVISDSKEKLEVIIYRKKSVIINAEDQIALDVPDAIVDAQGTVRTYEINKSEAQEFNIEQLDDGYHIYWGNYSLCHNGVSVYLSADDNSKNSIWYIEKAE